MQTQDSPDLHVPAREKPPPASDALTFGEAMALFIADAPGRLETVEYFHKTAAGAELNVAIGLGRLGFQVDYLSAVGADSFGRYLHALLQREGIDTRFLRIDPSRPTGFMLKTRVDDGSDPQIEYHRSGSAASMLSPADIRWSGFPARHLHLTGIAIALSPQTRELAFTLARQAREAGARISFDPNLRPQLWPSQHEMIETMNALAALCDVVLPGIEEARLLTGQTTPQAMARFYLERGAHQVAIKLGPEGAYCLSSDDDSPAGTIVPGVPVSQVVDTVGAGDGFATGVISALLDGLSLQDAAMRGNQIAARVIQFPGDSTGLPDRATLISMT